MYLECRRCSLDKRVWPECAWRSKTCRTRAIEPVSANRVSLSVVARQSTVNFKSAATSDCRERFVGHVAQHASVCTRSEDCAHVATLPPPPSATRQPANTHTHTHTHARTHAHTHARTHTHTHTHTLASNAPMLAHVSQRTQSSGNECRSCPSTCTSR
jgi:hypothetical protein